jgi:hypothetical protein
MRVGRSQYLKMAKRWGKFPNSQREVEAIGLRMETVAYISLDLLVNRLREVRPET